MAGSRQEAEALSEGARVWRAGGSRCCGSVVAALGPCASRLEARARVQRGCGGRESGARAAGTASLVHDDDGRFTLSGPAGGACSPAYEQVTDTAARCRARSEEARLDHLSRDRRRARRGGDDDERGWHKRGRGTAEQEGEVVKERRVSRENEESESAAPSQSAGTLAPARSALSGARPSPCSPRCRSPYPARQSGRARARAA